jgi:hypothetical protein
MGNSMHRRRFCGVTAGGSSTPRARAECARFACSDRSHAASRHRRSDVDLLVDLGPGRTLLDLAGFRREAEEIVGTPIDVATPDMLKERVRAEVLGEAVPL